MKMKTNNRIFVSLRFIIAMIIVTVLYVVLCVSFIALSSCRMVATDEMREQIKQEVEAAK
jgi:hypothetical protein